MNQVTDKHIAAEIDIHRTIVNALSGDTKVLLNVLTERFPDYSEAVRTLRAACEKALERLPVTYCGYDKCSSCIAARSLRAALEQTKDL